MLLIYEFLYNDILSFPSTSLNNIRCVEPIEYFLIENMHFCGHFAAPWIVPRHSSLARLRPTAPFIKISIHHQNSGLSVLLSKLSPKTATAEQLSSAGKQLTSCYLAFARRTSGNYLIEKFDVPKFTLTYK
jgi:hypothetical protein